MTRPDNGPQPDRYWKRVAGVDLFKVNYYFKYYLYKAFGVTLPKLKDQREYWSRRGRVYMDEFLSSGYGEREIFFQDLLVEQLRGLRFESVFEAGCGFGWNLKRLKEEFPSARVGGIDFSETQLANAGIYLRGHEMELHRADATTMPMPDNHFDVGFTVGVFMNIHPSKINAALREMIRVCKRYIIHVEYDQNHTTPELREKRAFKTNIVSHDYQELYKSLGQRVKAFLTHRDFGQRFESHARSLRTDLHRWEGFEGPEKYIILLVEVNKQ